MSPNSHLPLALLLLIAGLVIWSGIGPHERLTWLLEVMPVLIAAPLLVATWRRFPLTPMAYVLIAVHAAILIVGSHYTYARVPAGTWLAEWLDLARNPYDRLGHLAQGFIPAIVAREILIRMLGIRGGWLFFLVVCICLAVSAFYELIEWWTALAAGDGATDFLGTQGDVWDTQWDMALALTGAIAAQLLLGRWHSRQLAALRNSA